ncbi:cytochrome c oxidase assembly protein [Actinacidiphila acidipaludis]|uniref:Cytochrome c oxidase assembly protein n=1 Tax=Actinacidiphila acidipaludis TaxID=2873382 RepID=A0ABS7Q1A4_9ACTN|nr:cytochrome c oxidase assembly protein [Streptomyces acidipaludis]MBY8876661.1 cytochrome c oxidase assembly protein [Streptomyces acidipaludis]
MPSTLALPELTGDRYVTAWQLDVPALTVVVLLGACYAYGVRRRRREGQAWPLWRTAAFYVVGLGMLVLATMSSLAVYDKVLFWPAAVQNILLDLFAPLGLALGDPLALAAPGGRLRRAFASRPVRVLTFPLVSSVLVLASELTIYFTPYFATALGNGFVLQLMHLQLVLTGCLFVLPMLSRQELLPRWCTHPVRAALVFFDGLFDSVPGIVVMTSGTLVAGHWYAAHPRTWGPSLQHDQMLGGGLMLTLAELVALPFILLVFVEWVRAERARTAELDARLDREAGLAMAAGSGSLSVPAPAGPSPSPSSSPSPSPSPSPAPSESAVPAPVTAAAPVAQADAARKPAPAGPDAAEAAEGADADEPSLAPGMSRPWWETDQGEVGMRMRRRR